MIMDHCLEWKDQAQPKSPNFHVPDNGLLKNFSWIVQYDVGCFEGGVVSLGLVLKSTDDRIVKASFQNFSSLTDVETIELMGITRAMHTSIDLNLENVIFQLDSLSVVDYINDISYSTTLELLVNECRQLLGNFKNAVVVFLSRNCNGNAHHMAHVGFRFGTQSWSGVIPPLEMNSNCNANLTSVSL